MSIYFSKSTFNVDSFIIPFILINNKLDSRKPVCNFIKINYNKVKIITFKDVQFLLIWMKFQLLFS